MLVKYVALCFQTSYKWIIIWNHILKRNHIFVKSLSLLYHRKHLQNHWWTTIFLWTVFSFGVKSKLNQYMQTHTGGHHILVNYVALFTQVTCELFFFQEDTFYKSYAGTLVRKNILVTFGGTYANVKHVLWSNIANQTWKIVICIMLIIFFINSQFKKKNMIKNCVYSIPCSCSKEYKG